MSTEPPRPVRPVTGPLPDHGYEPGDDRHPMQTDPLCRLCGEAKRRHRGER
jgi:hypothetical protein